MNDCPPTRSPTFQTARPPGDGVTAATAQSMWEGREARTSARRKTLLKGMIVFNRRLSTMDCTVLDISEMGARLKPIEFWSLPDEFELNLLCGAKHQCHIVHKRGDQFGVRFV